MSEFILDTNVLSELWKPNPNPDVAAWVELADWYLPAPVIAEMQLAVGKPELREYKAVYVQSDAEIGLFSDEVVVNCAP